MLKTAHHSTRRLSSAFAEPPAITGVLKAFFAAMSDALAVSRQYQRLRAYGLPHDTALERAVGIDPSPQKSPERGHPLCFAGRA